MSLSFDHLFEEHGFLYRQTDLGQQFLFRFENNVGASVVILGDPAPGLELCELAVLRFEEGVDSLQTPWLTYPENGVSDKSGLIRNLTLNDVADTLLKLEALE